MTIFLRSRLPLLVFLMAVCGTNGGCDLGTYAQRAESSSQGYVTPTVVAPQADSADEEKNDGSVFAGKWSMDATATANLVKRKVNPIIIGGPAEHNRVVAFFREGSLSFELKADGTFTCAEEFDSNPAEYKGNWEINGDKVAINQTHMNGSPVKDSLTGTVSGNKMDLVKKQQGISLPMILRRR